MDQPKQFQSLTFIWLRNYRYVSWLALVSLIPTGLLAWCYVTDVRIKLSGKTTIATVTEAYSRSGSRSSGRGRTKYYVDYQFTARDGKSYSQFWVHNIFKSSLTYEDYIKAKKSKLIEVSYLPADPKVNRPTVARNITSIAIFLGISLIATCGLFAAYWFSYRTSQRIARGEGIPEEALARNYPKPSYEESARDDTDRFSIGQW